MISQETTLCSTRYPIMLVHGVGARDSLEQCYWRRIPDYLRQRGAVVEFGFQDSWATVEQNAAMLATRIAWVCREYGCEKVNLIAHSKGGLDARYAISALGMEEQVASLTTLSTPHHGSRTVDFFFRFRGILKGAGVLLNRWYRRCGDATPDFYHTLYQFTTAFASQFNRLYPLPEPVYCQSYAATLRCGLSNIAYWLPHLFVRLFDGDNDGLVSPDSARFGQFQGVLESPRRAGISHSDLVDAKGSCFTQEKQPGRISEICEFYRDLVAGLKEKGF